MQPASCSFYLFLADKTQTKPRSAKVTKLSTLHENMTIPACSLVVVLLPCRPNSDKTQICEIYKIVKTHENIEMFACLLFASCLRWLASGLLCMVCVLLPFGSFATQAWCFLHVCPALSGLLLARSVGPVLSRSGLLCPDRGPNIVHFVLKRSRSENFPDKS